MIARTALVWSASTTVVALAAVWSSVAFPAAADAPLVINIVIASAILVLWWGCNWCVLRAAMCHKCGKPCYIRAHSAGIQALPLMRNGLRRCAHCAADLFSVSKRPVREQVRRLRRCLLTAVCAALIGALATPVALAHHAWPAAVCAGSIAAIGLAGAAIFTRWVLCPRCGDYFYIDYDVLERSMEGRREKAPLFRNGVVHCAHCGLALFGSDLPPRNSVKP